ncbi:MAG: hypothetical protein PHV18_04270 [Lachnospiraceae bacterium]|nr:hypothetical protein [Lachnospiraceae bacterium]
MGARIGFVSSYDPATGMASVYYPSRSDTSAMIPVFSPFGATQELKKDDMVLVEHLEDGSAVILGGFAGENPSAAGIAVIGGSMIIRDTSGSVTVGQLIQAVKLMHQRGSG